MHLKNEDITHLEIYFDSGIIPPPYSNQYFVKFRFEKNFLDTHFQISYTGREEISEEEILEEGFSLDDDFNYQGEIPVVWKQPIKKLYASSKWSNKNLQEETGGIYLQAKDRHGQKVKSVPLNQEEWKNFSQELIQAIFELSRKEKPLLIHYMIREDKNETMLALEMKFSIREVDLTVNGKKKTADWEQTKELLYFVFLPDYDYELAQETKPSQSGYYIECGDGFWHNLDMGALNLDPKFDAVAKIKSGFAQLIDS